MKDRMERFVVLPFSIGCASQSSVAVGINQPKKPKSDHLGRQEGEESSSSSKERIMKNYFGFLALPKPYISCRMQRLIRSVKSFSQLFLYKEEKEEMEIGFPTDVKHVTHIGLDGTTTTNLLKGWENLNAPEIISFPSISLRHFELAMSAQAINGALVVDDDS